MSSRKAIHNKTLPRSEELERILVKDFYLMILFPHKLRLRSDD